MHCLLCESLELAFEARRSEYIEATSLANYRISKRFAAYKNVEMERARTELEEHRSACAFTGAVAAQAPVETVLRITHREKLRGHPVGSAA